MRISSSASKSSLMFLAVVTVALPVTRAAAVTTVSSSAYGVSANLTLLGFVTASVGPIASIGGISPPDYTLTTTVLSLNQNLALGVQGVTTIGQAIGTGVETSTASAALPLGQGSSTVNNLATALTTKLAVAPAITILGLGAGTVTSTSSINGTGVLTATGSSTITGLTVNGLALGVTTIDGSAFVNPAPNTILLSVLGLKIILNEQLLSGNGTTQLGLTTNAIHATFTNFLVGGGLLSGDLIVGQSTAAISVDAVPEPASWAMMIAGFAMIGAANRNRRRALVA